MSDQPTPLPADPKKPNRPPNRPVKPGAKPSPKPKPGGRPKATPFTPPIRGNVKVTFEVEGGKITIEGTAAFVQLVISALFSGGGLPESVIARLKLVSKPGK
jgi:hypothetical protein